MTTSITASDDGVWSPPRAATPTADPTADPAADPAAATHHLKGRVPPMSDPARTPRHPSPSAAPHDHPHDPGHPHDHAHASNHGRDDRHGRDHPHGRGRAWRALAHLPHPHGHESADKLDAAMESSADGMRTLWVSLAVLGATAALQAAVVAVSGSVALLGDTLHNAADALTALPLAVAFMLGRRVATRRFTYGFGRAEDLAGIVILAVIAGSSVLAAVTAIDRLTAPREISHLPAVAAAALAGFAGNEWVARYRIRTGRRIGSAALVADGLHARTDGLASLAVLLGAAGAALGLPLADPIIGLLITAAIALVLKDAAREVLRRMMDAVDPAVVDAAEAALRRVPGVHDVAELRGRWVGHRLRAEAVITIDGSLSLRAAHHIAVEAEHALLHAVPRLTAALIHTDPTPGDDEDPHAALAHHHAPARAGLATSANAGRSSAGILEVVAGPRTAAPPRPGGTPQRLLRSGPKARPR